MQKFFTKKAFLLFTLLFVSIAAFSFAAFEETEPACTAAKSCCRVTPLIQNGEMIWEVISRRFLTLLFI